MSVEQDGNPVGRPLIEITDKEFKGLCSIHCTKVEIAAYFQCSDDTIQNWCKRTYDKNFSAIHEEYASSGNVSLRRIQWRQAEDSVPMSKWLGQQHLGQREKVEERVHVSNKDDNRNQLLRIAKDEGLTIEQLCEREGIDYDNVK